MTTRRQRGADAETQAVAFIERCGLLVLYRNWTCRYGEIDIIAKDKDGATWIFVEVRTRQHHGAALASIGPRKQQRLCSAALHFLQTHTDYTSDMAWRYDVVIVTPHAIQHVPNAIET